MMTLRIRNWVYAATALSALAYAGAIAPANAAPNLFSVDEACADLNFADACVAPFGEVTGIESIQFSWAAVIDQQVVGPTALDGDDTFTEKGFLNFNAYIDDTNDALPSELGGGEYDLYATFDSSGVAELSGGVLTATAFTFTMDFFLDPANDTTLTLPANTAGNITVTDPGADDRLLATATILATGNSQLIFDLGAGTFTNGSFSFLLTDLGLEMLGEDFFSDPDPFYTSFFISGDLFDPFLDFTVGSLLVPFTALADGSGNLIFAVPEPGTLGLLAIGLLALGYVGRRRIRGGSVA